MSVGDSYSQQQLVLRFICWIRVSRGCLFSLPRGRYGREVPGVDPSRREQYLDDKEFIEVFGMSKSDFASQPKWKQVWAKKVKELF